MGFLKRHYEKILLGLLLAIFIGLLAFQLVLWQRSQEIQVEKMKGFKDPDPNYTRIDFKSEKSPFRVLQDLPKKPIWAKPTSRENAGISVEVTDFMKPFPLAICPYCLRIIPAKSFPEGEGAGSCMFCKKTLHHPYSIEAENANKDTDGDGIPDQEEVKLGLNPNDSSDARIDSDGDGFSNFEEFVSKTDYKNPKSRPPYHEKLYVYSVERPKLPFKVQSIKYKNDKNKSKDGAVIQMGVDYLRAGSKQLRQRLMSQTVGSQFSSRAGDYVIVDLVIKEEKDAVGIVRDLSQVVIQKKGQTEKIMMRINETVYEPHVNAVLQIAKTGKPIETHEVLENAQFKIGSEMTGIDQYTVVRIIQNKQSPDKSTVVVRFDKDGKEYVLGTVSAMELKIEKQREKARKTRPARRPEDANS